MQAPALHIRDLLTFTAVIALTIAIANLAVAYRDHGIASVALATPIPLTALIHRRFSLDWRVATGLHYPIAIAWAFGFGVAYSLAFRRVPQTFFERDSVGLEYPLQFGLFSMQIMAVAALASTAGYALISYFLSGRPQNRTQTNG